MLTRPPFPEYIDSTMMEDAICSRKFYYRFIHQWNKIGGSVHLHAGAALADGLHAYRASYYAPGPFCGDYTHAVAEGWRHIVDKWGDYKAPLDSPKQLWRVLEAFGEYVHHWSPLTDHITPHTVNNLPAAEISFAEPLKVLHPLTGDPIHYVGRIDLVGVFEKALWIIDDKTCTQLGKTWMDSWLLRGQFQGYMRVAREYGYPVIGTKIRAACFRSKGVELAEATVLWRDWLADEWWDSVNFRVAHLLERWHGNYWPKSFNSACTAYSGCDFRSICLTPDESLVVPFEYERHIWDPVNRVDRTEPINYV